MKFSRYAFPVFAAVMAFSVVGCSDSKEADSKIDPFIEQPLPEVENYKVELSPPAVKSDGSLIDLSNLSHYVVELKRADGSEERVVEINPEGEETVEHQIQGFPKGEWMLRVKAVDVEGGESEWSGEAFVRIGEF